MAQAWAVWILIAIASALVEIATPTFGFIFASLAALMAALASLWMGVALQIVVFAIVLVASLVLLRPKLVEKFHTHDQIPSRTQALVGKAGVVTEAIDPVVSSGRVTVEGQDWAARATGRIAAGATVVVDGADGITLIVRSR